VVDGAAGASERAPNLELVRVRVAPAGAFGVLVAEHHPIAVTLEPTWALPDAPAVQSVKIPVGRYLCRRSWFHRGAYETFEVVVPGHSRLLFHRGNVEEDSEGCILVGRRFNPEAPRILESVLGFADFMRWADRTFADRVSVPRSSYELLVRSVPS
jgi:hypothetical protein